jgi:hypothetical protein
MKKWYIGPGMWWLKAAPGRRGGLELEPLQLLLGLAFDRDVHVLVGFAGCLAPGFGGGSLVIRPVREARQLLRAAALGHRVHRCGSGVASIAFARRSCWPTPIPLPPKFEKRPAAAAMSSFLQMVGTAQYNRSRMSYSHE